MTRGKCRSKKFALNFAFGRHFSPFLQLSPFSTPFPFLVSSPYPSITSSSFFAQQDTLTEPRFGEKGFFFSLPNPERIENSSGIFEYIILRIFMLGEKVCPQPPPLLTFLDTIRQWHHINSKHGSTSVYRRKHGRTYGALGGALHGSHIHFLNVPSLNSFIQNNTMAWGLEEMRGGVWAPRPS